MMVKHDNLTHPQVLALLQEHLADMHAWSPPESVHALDLSALRGPGIDFFSAWHGEALLAIGALKVHDSRHAEIKSMRTPKDRRHQGGAKHMLAHLLAHARAKGVDCVSLETGSQPEFEPARTLYAKAGFGVCGPFSDYKDDPLSVFMTIRLCDRPA